MIRRRCYGSLQHNGSLRLGVSLKRFSTAVNFRSKVFMPIKWNSGTKFTSRSHELLVRVGFIHQSMSGVFHWLPAGHRVLSKLEAIVDEELQRGPLYGQKFTMPLLSSAKNWKSSGRWDEYGPELFRLKDRRGNDLCLGPTFEEDIVDMVASVSGRLTAKSLPLVLYQISTKYRDEERARYGLLRGREFLMKDMYTFHADDACAQETYEIVCAAYHRIFKALNIDIVKVQASGGHIGGTHTHEFHLASNLGEDEIVHCDKGGFLCNQELLDPSLAKLIRDSKDSTACSVSHCTCEGTGNLSLLRTIEVGHTFILGTKYSKALGANVELKGKVKPVEMACYGIGISRLLAAIIETSGGHDKDGIIWPNCIAPYQNLILTGSGNKEQTSIFYSRALEFVKHAQTVVPHTDFMIDDRVSDSFGRRFAEAKLIGYPRIIVFGKAFEEKQLCEVIDRKTLKSTLMTTSEVMLLMSNEKT